MAQPFVAIAGVQAHAVGIQAVEGALDLGQRRVHIGQRQRAKQAESGRVVAHQLRAVVVAGARQLAGLRRVAKPQARVGDRHHRRRDATGIHVVDRLLRRPAGVGRLQRRPATHPGQPCRRGEMVVQVNDLVGAGRRICGAGWQYGAAAARHSAEPQRSAKQPAPGQGVGLGTVGRRDRLGFGGHRLSQSSPAMACQANADARRGCQEWMQWASPMTIGTFTRLPSRPTPTPYSDHAVPACQSRHTPPDGLAHRIVRCR